MCFIMWSEQSIRPRFLEECQFHNEQVSKVKNKYYYITCQESSYLEGTAH